MGNKFHIVTLLNRLILSQKHNKEYFMIKKTRNIEIILKFLFKGNFIKTYFTFKQHFIVFLKFKSTSILKKIEIVSLPSKKIYINLYKLRSLIYKNRTSFFLLSTSKGILSSDDALKLNIAGEILFKITI